LQSLVVNLSAQVEPPKEAKKEEAKKAFKIKGFHHGCAALACARHNAGRSRSIESANGRASGENGLQTSERIF
jgi:hypothetical protein